MIYRNKKFLLWFVSFGKVKARIMHFLFLCIAYLLFMASFEALVSLRTHASFSSQWKDNLSFSLFFFICAPFASWRFYDIAMMQLKDYRALQKKGLTMADLSRIAFVRKWHSKRQQGLKPYCLFEGGIIMGLLLLFPVLLFISFSIEGLAAVFAAPETAGIFVIKNIFISFIIGLAIFRLRWSLNERKFARLTNPIA